MQISKLSDLHQKIQAKLKLFLKCHSNVSVHASLIRNQRTNTNLTDIKNEIPLSTEHYLAWQHEKKWSNFQQMPLLLLLLPPLLLILGFVHLKYSTKVTPCQTALTNVNVWDLWTMTSQAASHFHYPINSYKALMPFLTPKTNRLIALRYYVPPNIK